MLRFPLLSLGAHPDCQDHDVRDRGWVGEQVVDMGATIAELETAGLARCSGRPQRTTHAAPAVAAAAPAPVVAAAAAAAAPAAVVAAAAAAAAPAAPAAAAAASPQSEGAAGDPHAELRELLQVLSLDQLLQVR
jgi:hypothetical protein